MGKLYTPVVFKDTNQHRQHMCQYVATTQTHERNKQEFVGGILPTAPKEDSKEVIKEQRE